MADRSVEARLIVDVRKFVDAMKRIGVGLEPYIEARLSRIRRMHSAYSRRRGRGRW